MVKTGRLLGAAGAWIGRQSAAAYRGVDPDLRQHLAQLPLLGLTMLVPGQDEVRPLPDDGHRPLVLVHGLGGGPGNFFPLRSYLRLVGRTRVYTVRLTGGVSLPELGERLADFLERVATANGLPAEAQVDVVAHSLGGLVARLSLDDERARRRVATLVTMGTPHAGSHLARYGAMASSLALRPDSAVFTRLAGQLPWPGPPSWPRLVSLWSTADVILLPACSACVAGAENVELPGVTHYGYLLGPSVWDRVNRLLLQG